MNVSNLKLYNCAELTEADPACSKPTDFNLLNYFIKHGSIQPKDGFVRDNGDRIFCADYYERFPWLEYSIYKQKAFCFFCCLFALPSTL